MLSNLEKLPQHPQAAILQQQSPGLARAHKLFYTPQINEFQWRAGNYRTQLATHRGHKRRATPIAYQTLDGDLHAKMARLWPPPAPDLAPGARIK